MFSVVRISSKALRVESDTSRKAIFIDRDGTINKEVNLLYKIEDFELLPGVVEAIKKINQSEYLAIVITNQPVVARGLCTIDELEKFHKKMETLLGLEGAKLDAVYYCPHHPDKGYPEENKAYKMNCNCRKPDIGMVLNAAKDFNIDLEKSFFIGDSDNDILCGENSGLKTIKVKQNQVLIVGKEEPDFYKIGLGEAAEFVLDRIGEQV